MREEGRKMWEGGRKEDLNPAQALSSPDPRMLLFTLRSLPLPHSLPPCSLASSPWSPVVRLYPKSILLTWLLSLSHCQPS